MIRPEDTHVFATGISSYALDPAWHLPHAADHAAEFALWARRAGVDPQRIHLFLSQADLDRHKDALGRQGITPRRATFTEITQFVEQELTAVTGDLLYVFWAGHGSVSQDARRVLFFEDLSRKNQHPFDLNDFLARLRTSSFERLRTQIAYIDACANRFEELGFGASLGEARSGKGHTTYAGILQHVFFAADTGEQAKEGTFGAAILKALGEEMAANNVWPPQQDAIVSAVRPLFEKSRQHPIQLVWTTGDGGQYVRERTSGDLPASRAVNAAALSRDMPVRALRRLAEIALSDAALAEDSAAGEQQRDLLWTTLLKGVNRAGALLTRSSPHVEMLHIVGAALQWKAEDILAAEFDRRGPAAEFQVELDRLDLIAGVRTLIGGISVGDDELRDEYTKTMGGRSREESRADASSIDGMLDELYQISGESEPRAPVWEFLMRVRARLAKPTDRDAISAFLQNQKVPQGVLDRIQKRLDGEQRFVLSIDLQPDDNENPQIETIHARLFVVDTATFIETFTISPIGDWKTAAIAIAGVVQKARDIVLNRYRRDDKALIIEFLMPAELLTELPEQVPIALRRNKVVPLSQLHSVVLRLRERIAQRDRAINIFEWETIGARIKRNVPSTVHWMNDGRKEPTVKNCEGLVVLEFLPNTDLLDIVDIGFPFLAWLQGHPPGGWAAFRQQFQLWAAALKFSELPRELRDIRQTPAGVGADLRVLWDDPEQIDHWFRLTDVSGGS